LELNSALLGLLQSVVKMLILSEEKGWTEYITF